MLVTLTHFLHFIIEFASMEYFEVQICQASFVKGTIRPASPVYMLAHIVML